MKKILLFSAIAITLTGCQSAGEIAIKDCSNRPRWSDSKMQCLINHPQASNYNANQKEIIAYDAVLLEKIKRREITETDADFEETKYVNSINDRTAKTAALWRMGGPRYTNCNSYGYGVNCYSY